LGISPIRYEFNKIAPFKFYCFGSNYYVISANIKYSKYLGWKLKGIGGLSVRAFSAATIYRRKTTTENKIPQKSIKKGLKMHTY
jgi:hypothetical protein